jgi:hypothetical protein
MSRSTPEHQAAPVVHDRAWPPVPAAGHRPAVRQQQPIPYSGRSERIQVSRIGRMGDGSSW